MNKKKEKENEPPPSHKETPHTILNRFSFLIYIKFIYGSWQYVLLFIYIFFSFLLPLSLMLFRSRTVQGVVRWPI